MIRGCRAVPPDENPRLCPWPAPSWVAEITAPLVCESAGNRTQAPHVVDPIGSNPLIATAVSESSLPETAGSTERAPSTAPATHCESSSGNPINSPSFPFPDESEATTPEVSSKAQCSTGPFPANTWISWADKARS